VIRRNLNLNIFLRIEKSACRKICKPVLRSREILGDFTGKNSFYEAGNEEI
jgi:hypothetical protein